MTILHICSLDKFIPPFIDLSRKHFGVREQRFLTFGDLAAYPYEPGDDAVHIESPARQLFFVVKELYAAKKIILHSLSARCVIRLLFLQPWLLKKCHWFIWGADLYNHLHLPEKGFAARVKWRCRRFFIRRLGGLVACVEGDGRLAQECFGTKARFYECLMYPSNLYKNYAPQPKQGDTTNILVGNSADMSNNHFDIFEKLLPFKNKNFHIYCPLSYGNMAYARQVAVRGKELFGKKFTPLQDFMPFDRYLVLLGQIDIAIFAHKRQQALGNTITLLGLGKKVYLRTDVTPWQMFQKIGIKVFDVETVTLAPLDPATASRNAGLVKNYFSEEKLVEQLGIFYRS